MKNIFPQTNLRKRRQSGLTLLEMMVATTLLVVMMLGLTAMFNQTQRAFRSGLKQVDVFEGGRAVMDLVARDIEQAIRTKSAEDWSLYVALPPGSTFLTNTPPVLGDPALRTNLLYEVFFYNYSTLWSALGYRVLDPNNVDATNLLYGSLYRFSTNFSEFNGNIPNEHLSTFFKSPSVLTNESLTRVADGVVHFRVRFYDFAGKLIPLPDADGYIDISTTNLPPDVRLLPSLVNGLPNEPRVICSNTVPAVVEIELGILEPQTLEQARSVVDPAKFLEDRASKVHIFRQQIPIRNATR